MLFWLRSQTRSPHQSGGVLATLVSLHIDTRYAACIVNAPKWHLWSDDPYVYLATAVDDFLLHTMLVPSCDWLIQPEPTSCVTILIEPKVRAYDETYARLEAHYYYYVQAQNPRDGATARILSGHCRRQELPSHLLIRGEPCGSMSRRCPD